MPKPDKPVPNFGLKDRKIELSSGLGSVRKFHKITNKLTQDQKIFRIIKILSDSGVPLSLKPLLDKIGSTQRTVEPEFFKNLIEKKIIVKALHGSDNTAKYTIGEKGEFLLKTLKDLKTNYPNHPLFEFDIFNPSVKEAEDDDKKNIFELKFGIESRQNKN
ncbi:MAG: hypothetical protein HOD60_15500 [Candidatus Nitrosopelagicus sp.]|nr:hypothetical protein [Candidatus Nitrosopelagicus sp.]